MLPLSIFNPSSVLYFCPSSFCICTLNISFSWSHVLLFLHNCFFNKQGNLEFHYHFFYGSSYFMISWKMVNLWFFWSNSVFIGYTFWYFFHNSFNYITMVKFDHGCNVLYNSRVIPLIIWNMSFLCGFHALTSVSLTSWKLLSSTPGIAFSLNIFY